MAMHHYLRLSFIVLFVITSCFCIYFIIKKRSNKKAPKLLSEEKYNSSMTDGMKEISSNDSFFNIWPYVSELKAAKILSKKIKESDLVHKVYRNSTEDFEHILLATEKENHFVKVVVDRNKKKAMGYLFLDL
ncbi:hypothetical protein B0A67_09025 [Flavobacterium aquidurense]|jgi:hypothetical protein|uniref:hypothetical protein n=1 Tax=Flavobacterium aquidurense TaxID=362413 RepID=UPI00091FD69F|nr:hypothetical protein [Flavobacterium aquidurense]OXA72197.1 hypothetical protein B0A67_09025 [Flavobacterium aquidurense]SHG45466.1 hypothetical protein SAMN05444481_104274 [Flavobacterium frigidimaris]